MQRLLFLDVVELSSTRRFFCFLLLWLAEVLLIEKVDDVHEAIVLVLDETYDVSFDFIDIRIHLQPRVFPLSLNFSVRLLDESLEADSPVLGHPQHLLGIRKAKEALLLQDLNDGVFPTLVCRLGIVDEFEAQRLVVERVRFNQLELHVSPSQLVTVGHGIHGHLVGKHLPVLEV